MGLAAQQDFVSHVPGRGGGKARYPAICAQGPHLAYTLRYAAELRNPAKYFSEVKKASIDDEQLSLARELIQRKAGKFDPHKFTDNYEAALRELVEAKMKHLPLPLEEKPARRAKVINLMDALRRSVKGQEQGEKKPPAREGGHKAARAGKTWAACCRIPEQTWIGAR